MLRWGYTIDQAFTAKRNMEKDLEFMKKTDRPILRLYYFFPAAISLGKHQDPEKQINLPECFKNEFEWIHRPTGGGTVFHAQTEVAYSITSPEKYFPDLHQSYKDFCGAVILGLKHLGIKAEYKSIGDIVVDGKKIAGCAQVRKDGKLLHQGAISLVPDYEKMFSIIKNSDCFKEAEMTSITEQRGYVTPLAVIYAITKGFEEYFNTTFKHEDISFSSPR